MQNLKVSQRYVAVDTPTRTVCHALLQCKQLKYFFSNLKYKVYSSVTFYGYTFPHHGRSPKL